MQKAKIQKLSGSLGATFRTAVENQQADKHVESIWIPCLDQGSKPCYSTPETQKKRSLYGSVSFVIMLLVITLLLTTILLVFAQKIWKKPEHLPDEETLQKYQLSSSSNVSIVKQELGISSGTSLRVVFELFSSHLYPPPTHGLFLAYVKIAQG